jgi:hypothetical protein
MKRAAIVIVAVMLAGAGTAHAQDANPISQNMKGSWTNIRDLITKMADKMPAEEYRFKPMPELQDFGVRIAHAANFMMRGCATVSGDGKTLTLSAAPTKAEVQTALKDAATECDGVFNALTDADLVKTITAGRGGPRPKQAILAGMVLEHSQEMYGYMAVYLRLKGIVPPSSDRNER